MIECVIKKGLTLLMEWKIPSTRYQGSKRKLLPWIYEHLRQLRFVSALDLFGGTAVVAYLFKRMGKSVTYNDYLRFNYYRGKAIIENSEVRLSPDDIEWVVRGPGTGRSFIEETFRGMYFTDDENAWLDRVTGNIEGLSSMYGGYTSEYKKALAYYALFESCLIKRPFNLFHRRNLYLRMNDVKRTFGNKVTWERPFEEVFKRFANEANSLVFSNGTENKATNDDALRVKSGKYDLVYIDPPYFCFGKNDAASDYFRMYHFLEGLANYAKWGELIDHSTSNIHLRSNGHGWVHQASAKGNLEQVISQFEGSTVVISYKSPGIPSQEEIVALLSKYKKNVQVAEKEYSYALSKANGNGRKNIELLAIGY